MSCKNCNESNQQIDSFNNDLAMSHMCKIIRLLIVCLLLSAVLLAASNAAWLYAWNQYDYSGAGESMRGYSGDGYSMHQDPARDLRELIPHAPDEQTRRMMEEIARKMER